MTHSGFAVIAGRPNVGKSTLLNCMVGRKIAIVSDKVQTTRNRISGVLTRPDLQIVFIDTPGIHRPRHKLGEYMTGVAERTLSDVDAVLFVVDGASAPGPGDRYVASLLSRVQCPVITVLNKVDLLPGKTGEAPPHAAEYASLVRAREVIPVSAVTGHNVERLIEAAALLMPEGPMYYPEDEITDKPEQFLAAELIREKILLLTREEVPHSVAVDIEEMIPRKDDLIYISATIYVERESQKGIIVGEGGRLLKEVGRLARLDIEALLGNRVYLELWAKVKKDWRNRESVLRSLGYNLDV
ncbi:MAG: GTPase Era [Ignavibacteriales bacterium]